VDGVNYAKSGRIGIYILLVDCSEDKSKLRRQTKCTTGSNSAPHTTQCLRLCICIFKVPVLSLWPQVSLEFVQQKLVALPLRQNYAVVADYINAVVE